MRIREVRHIECNMRHKEVEEFIQTQRVMRLSTADSKGKPHAAALWYVSDGKNIYFSSDEDTKKIRNLKENPSVSLLLDSGTELFDVKGVLVHGKAELERDKDKIKMIRKLYAEKYFNSPDDISFKKLEYYMRNQIFVRVSIDKVSSWDYRKWKRKW